MEGRSKISAFPWVSSSTSQKQKHMRKLVLLFTAICITTLASAQIEKGRIQLQGGLLYNSNENTGFKNTNLTIQPQVGFYIADNISIGPSLAYRRSTSPSQIGGERVQSEFQFGAFARFNKTVADNFYLFIQPSIQFGSGTIEDGNIPDSDINTFDFSIRPGATYFLSDRFALDLNLSLFRYSSLEAEGGITRDTDSFNVGLNLSSVGLGLSYFLK